MSMRTFMAIVAAVIVLLALPLIAQTVKAISGRPTAVALQNTPREVETAEALPSTTEPIQPTPSQPAALTHTYDAPQETFVAENIAQAVPVMIEPIEPDPSQPPVMTRMQFNQVNSGMTYEQCVRRIGCEGEFVRTVGPGGEEFAWQLVDSPSSTVSTGEATLTFQNGILCGKGFSSNQGRRGSYETMLSAAVPAQRPAAPPYICRSVFDGLKDGCAYEECVRRLGVEGSYLGSRAMSGGTLSADGTPIPAIGDVYIWHNPANQATLTLSFRDGRLTAREISGGSGAAGGFGG